MNRDSKSYTNVANGRNKLHKRKPKVCLVVVVLAVVLQSGIVCTHFYWEFHSRYELESFLLSLAIRSKLKNDSFNFTILNE